MTPNKLYYRITDPLLHCGNDEARIDKGFPLIITKLPRYRERESVVYFAAAGGAQLAHAGHPAGHPPAHVVGFENRGNAGNDGKAQYWRSFPHCPHYNASVMPGNDHDHGLCQTVWS